MAQVGSGGLLGVGQRRFPVFRQLPQDRVHKTARTAVQDGGHGRHRFVDGRGGGDPIQKEQLKGPQSEDPPGQGVGVLDPMTGVVGHRAIQAALVPKHAVAELRGQPAISGGK